MTIHVFTRSTLAFLSLSIGQLAIAQQIPEKSKLPCDEVVETALEDVSPEEIKRINAFTPAQIIERKNPRYPERAARSAKEGWVLVSYVIDEEGKVKDPIIEDYAGYRGFRSAAIRAIEDWQYTPAMKNGKPTEQCHQQVRLDFIMSGNHGATRKFVSRYKKASQFLKNGDIEQAEILLAQLKDGEYQNRYENAWLSNLELQIANQVKDMPRELQSIDRTLATADTHDDGKGTFDDEYLGYLHQRKFVLEVQQGKLADALATVKKIESLKNADALLAGIQKTLDSVKEFITSDAYHFVEGELQNNSSFFHTLARNKFAFTEVQGKLETVEVRCDTHREVFTIAEGFVWSIPESWGKCRVLVRGDTGTRFALVEVNQV